jgi:hypothetical protein
MKEQIISLETAKLAKNCGLEGNSNIYYTNDCDELLRGVWEVNITKDLKEYYLAPTQSLLQKWLREEHNCYIEITYDFYTTGVNFNYQVWFYSPIDIECVSDKSTGMYGDNAEYQTYEQALEYGLKHALKLIEQNN